MSAIADELWPEERNALRPSERLSVSAWAERHIVLDPVNHAYPGPLRLDMTPYLREILDSWTDPAVRRIVVMGGTQWGKTLAATILLGFTIAERPRPILFAMATEVDVVAFGTGRLVPMFERCAPVRARLSKRKADNHRQEIRYLGGRLKFAWPSASRLASDALGAALLDEVEKYPAWTGDEADPISLARERLQWYRHDAKEWLSSTPKLAGGRIDSEFALTDRRRFHVPCPLCGHRQVLHFSPKTLRWPEDERDPEAIRERRLAWYVCEACDGEIPDDREIHERMLLGGIWIPDGGKLDRDGRIVGARLDHPLRGFHLSSFYSPMRTWSDIAAEFVASRDKPAQLQNFLNSWLGVPWQETDQAVSFERLAQRATETPAGVVPHGAIALVAGADVQARGIYWTVRAFWPGGRSHTVESGICETFAELRLLVVDRSWDVEAVGPEPAAPMRVSLLCVDNGYRTDEVYAWTIATERTRPVKGEDGDEAGIPIRQTRVERTLAGKPAGLSLWLVRVGYFKSRLARAMNATAGADRSWTVHADPAIEYLRQIASEHKAIERNRKTGAVSSIWKRRPDGGPNHWWDAEVYADAAADMLHLYRIRSSQDVAAIQAARERAAVRRQEDAVAEERRARIAERIRRSQERRRR